MKKLLEVLFGAKTYEPETQVEWGAWQSGETKSDLPKYQLGKYQKVACEKGYAPEPWRKV